MVARKAASPGIVEAITGFLVDNALTRSWADTVNRQVLGPLERMTVSDEVLAARVPEMIAEMTPWQGALGKQQVQALEALKGEAVNVAGVEEAVRAAPDAAQKVKDQAVSFINHYAPDRDAQLRAAKVVMDYSRSGIDENWSNARAWLAHPALAYSAVTAGGAMGTAAAMEAYDWWQSQQQQAEKEMQLPLQGGMVS